MIYFPAFADVEVRGFCVFRLFCVVRMPKSQWLHAPGVLTFEAGFPHAFQRTHFAAEQGTQVNSAAVCGFGEVFLQVDLFVTNQFVAVLSYMLAF